MDVTQIFRQVVQEVKKRKKVDGESLLLDKSILNSRKKSSFTKRASDVVGNISKLNEFLLSHRKDYINAAGVLGNDSSQMTDAERNQIDADAETFMKTCKEAIRALKADTYREHSTPQIEEHRFAVLENVESYLKAVCKVYSTQRAIRVKRVVDRKKISRLERESGKKSRTFVSQLDNKSTPQEGKDNKPSSDKPKLEASTEEKKTLESRVPLLFDDDTDFSKEESEQLAQENAQLYREMNSMVDEVRQIEGKVVEISKLQELFADKVIEQDRDIDRLGDTVVGSVENIKDANDEIREAMRNNAGLRVWILFFLIVLSLSLLFLDWYNP